MSKTILMVCSITLATGCRAGGGGGAGGSAGGGVPINTAPPVDELEDATHASLAGCATGDVEANLAIVRELRDSYHEMIVCGGLAMSFNNSVSGVITSALYSRARGGKGFTYLGNGAYEVGNGMMIIRATAGTDTASWKAGDPLTVDILDPDSYLVGVAIDATGAIDAAAGGGSAGGILMRAAGSLEITFQAKGPAADLLGLAEADLRLGRLRVNLKKIEETLARSIALAQEITVDDKKGGTEIDYRLEGPARLVRETSAVKNVPMQLVSIDARRAESGQAIRITEWTMQFQGDMSKGALDGTIGMDVDGGAFPYHVVLSYPHRKEPDVRLSCR